MNVAFLLNDLHLSGGVSTVVEHARRLTDRHGWRVALVLVREPDVPDWQYRKLAGLPVFLLDEVADERFDVAVATWWETTSSLFRLQAERYAYFVQNLEERFYLPGQHADRLGAAVTHNLPVAYLTEARWIAQALEDGRRGVQCYYVRNGVDKDVFALRDQLDVRLHGPLRILIEGRADVWFKGVGEALSAVATMQEPRHVTLVTPDRSGIAGDAADRVVGPLTHEEMAELYSETDVVLKLSRVEGMFGPPLEGFHCGATCVVTPVTGHEEYVVHGWNGLVVDWDDLRGTAASSICSRAIAACCTFSARTPSRRPAAGRRRSSRATSWQAPSLPFADVPPPDATARTERLLNDVRAAIEGYRVQLQEREELEYAASVISWARAHPLAKFVRRARRRRSSGSECRSCRAPCVPAAPRVAPACAHARCERPTTSIRARCALARRPVDDVILSHVQKVPVINDDRRGRQRRNFGSLDEPHSR